MKTLDLKDLAGLPIKEGEAALATAVLEEFRLLDQNRGRVYTTYARIAGTPHTLITASKDVHLGIGRLSEQGLASLCQLLRIFSAHEGQFLLKRDENQDRDTLLITVTQNDQGYAFHLAPAH